QTRHQHPPCSARSGAEEGTPTPSLPLHSIPLENRKPCWREEKAIASLRCAPDCSPKVCLTIPITSATIIPPASLRFDHMIGIRRNADRLPLGTLIDFPRIRRSAPKNQPRCLARLRSRCRQRSSER